MMTMPSLLVRRALMVASVVLVAGAALSGAPAVAAIIDNGTVQLGINDTGNLDVLGVSGATTGSMEVGTTEVGLRYIPTNGDALAPGCFCEGWGVADAGTTSIPSFAGYVNLSADSGAHDLIIQAGTGVTVTSGKSRPDSSGSAFKSVVATANGRLRVTHDFQPSTATSNLYRILVTIDNIGEGPIADLRYRRVMDWDIAPHTFSEWVEIHVGSVANLIVATTDGFRSANPLDTPGPITPAGGNVPGSPPTSLTGGSSDYFAGPSDQGALFDFKFGPLKPGESKSFTIFYGAAGSRSDALAAIRAVGAEVYSLGIPRTDTSPYSAAVNGPHAFIFAASGVGGAALTNNPPVANPFTVGTALPLNGTLTLAASSLTATDTDPDNDSLTVIAVTATESTHGTVSLANGFVTYVPDRNYSGPASFDYSVSDGHGGFATGTVTLAVAPNQPPYFDAIADQIVVEAETIQITGVRPGPPEQEEGQVVTLTATSEQTTLIKNLTVSGTGSTRTLSYQRVLDETGATRNGIAKVVVTAQDDGGTLNGGFDFLRRTFEITLNRDNCPNIPNPDQLDSDNDGTGDACDPTPLGPAADGKVTTNAKVSPPASGSGYAQGESIQVTAAVKFDPIDFNGNGTPDPYFAVLPTPYNVILSVVDSAGQTILADRILEGPPTILAVPGSGTNGDLVQITGTSQTFTTVIPLTDWFTRLRPGLYRVLATYVNYLKDPEKTCSGADCLLIWLGTAPAGSVTLTIGDQCPNDSIPSGGGAAGTGCPVADKNTVTLKTVDIARGTSSVVPLPGAQVRVFDTQSPAFKAVISDLSKLTPELLNMIFDEDKHLAALLGFVESLIDRLHESQVGTCITASNGVCFAGEAFPGTYLVIVKYFDQASGQTVFTGALKVPKDFVNGIAQRSFLITKVLKNGVFQGFVPLGF